jgi:hypothetical protein
MQPNETREVLNRPIGQELPARDVTSLAGPRPTRASIFATFSRRCSAGSSANRCSATAAVTITSHNSLEVLGLSMDDIGETA